MRAFASTLEKGEAKAEAGSERCDLIVVGAGPSGLAVAKRVAAYGKKVCVVDPSPRSVWPNNYGVWVDEFEALGLADCLDKIWPRASVILNNGAEPKKLYRPYGRVDRKRLKERLYQGCLENGVSFKECFAEDLKHFSPTTGSALHGYSEMACSDGTTLRGKLVLDATGHAKKFTAYDSNYNPGYQGAYGILADVDQHPFDLDEMLFMDWRDDHMAQQPVLSEKNSKLPTFLYAMPFGETSVFLEETSLVARPEVPFDELKERLKVRLEHLGINVKKVHEEEYCLIPMGSSLPQIPQRVLSIGGAAGMVHPSTGYMVARMLSAAPLLADNIVDQLEGGQPAIINDPLEFADSQGPSAKEPKAQDFTETGNVANEVSLSVWESIWPKERLNQRAFFNFGMEILLSMDLKQTREFFTAFFNLSDYHWQGFLSSRLSLPELVLFGVSLFKKSTWETRFYMVKNGVPGLIGMLKDIINDPPGEKVLERNK